MGDTTVPVPPPGDGVASGERQPWFRRWWGVTIIVAGVVILLVSLGQGGEDQVATDEADATATDTQGTQDTEPADDPDPTEQPERDPEPTPEREPTEEPEPTGEPNPTAEPEDATEDAGPTEDAEPTEEPGPRPAFGSWQHVVGSDIAPGRYRATGFSLCYWERLSDFSGDFDAIIANETSTGESMVVDILVTDVGFDSQGCGDWYLAEEFPLADPGIPDGRWVVGLDVEPGRYRTDGGELCYWERLSDFTGDFDAILANDVVEGSAIVEIAPTDVGFSTEGCGVWEPAG